MPVSFEIRLAEEVDAAWAEQFPYWAARAHSADGPALRGTVPNQEPVFAALQQVRIRGLTLVSVLPAPRRRAEQRRGVSLRRAGARPQRRVAQPLLQTAWSIGPRQRSVERTVTTMEAAFSIPPLNLAVQLVGVGLMIVGPFVAALVLTRRLSAGWRLFWLGALVFVVSQLVLRLPLVGALQAALAPQLAGSPALSFALGAGLALTAALFETGGRWVGYRFLLRHDPKTWDTGVMFGLGHGGIESALLIGGLAIAQLAALLTTTEAQLAAMPAVQADALRALAAGVADVPAWFGLNGAYERVMAVVFHVAMSVLVLQSFARGEARWTWYALALHTVMDFVTPVLIPALLPAGTARLVAQQAFLTLIGALALGIIVALRSRRAPAGNGVAQRAGA